MYFQLLARTYKPQRVQLLLDEMATRQVDTAVQSEQIIYFKTILLIMLSGPFWRSEATSTEIVRPGKLVLDLQTLEPSL